MAGPDVYYVVTKPDLNRDSVLDPVSRGAAVAAMALEAIASSCTTGTCPTVYRSDRGTVVVQGYAISAETAGVDVPDGELLVEIPVELLRTAANKT
jgi:hypothetical protein